jgi:hypothetical protein
MLVKPCVHTNISAAALLGCRDAAKNTAEKVV